MRTTFALALLLVACSRSEHPRGVTGNYAPILRVVALHRDAVRFRVTNGIEDIAIFTPDSPHQKVDGENCRISLRTEVGAQIVDFVYAPRLLPVNARQDVPFGSTLDEPLVSKKCVAWTIDAEFAYIGAHGIELLQQHHADAFHS